MQPDRTNRTLRVRYFRLASVLAPAMGWVILAAVANAQTGVRPSGSYNGMFGSGNFTNSGSGNAGGGLGSQLGTGGSGSSFGGAGSSFSGSSQSSSIQTQGISQGPQNIQSQNFIGSSAATNANFRSMQGTNAAGVGPRGPAGLAGLQNLFSAMGQNGFNAQGQQAPPRAPLSIPIRLGFESRPVVGTQFTSRFSSRLAKLPGLKAVGPIEVRMEGRTAILAGTVASEADRQLAEGVARLEPEVLDVQNDLVVDSGATSGETPDSTRATPPPPEPGLLDSAPASGGRQPPEAIDRTR